MESKRLVKIRRMRGLTQEELSRRTRLSRPYISQLERGRSAPTVGTLESLARALGVSAASLLDEDDGEMLTPRDEHTAPVFDPGRGRDICAAMFQSITDGEYPPGSGEREEATTSLDPNAFYIVARGESMTGGAGRRVIHEGDLLLVEPNKEVRDGDIVLCRLLGSSESQALVKMVKHLNGKPARSRRAPRRIALLAINPDYPPLILESDHMKEVALYRITEIKRKV